MEQGESILRPTNLTFDQRANIFDKTVAKVTKDYFDPKFNGVDWPKIASERRASILSLDDAEAFELAMHDLVRTLGTSHTGFFHQSVRRVPARLAIGATFGKVDSETGGSEWIARDVHEAGPAHAAGLRPLDILKAINGTPVGAAQSTHVSDGHAINSNYSAWLGRTDADRRHPSAAFPQTTLFRNESRHFLHA